MSACALASQPSASPRVSKVARAVRLRPSGPTWDAWNLPEGSLRILPKPRRLRVVIAGWFLSRSCPYVP